MGCDIHMTVEKIVRPEGKWVAINTMNTHNGNNGKYSSPDALDRNYGRFALLAGVRGAGPEPRGIPDNASDTTRLLIDRWGTDGHSHSWLELGEACRRFLASEDIKFKPDSYEAKFPGSYYFGVESDEGDLENDFRVVFWFDN